MNATVSSVMTKRIIALFRDRLTIADASHRASQPAGWDAGADDLVAKAR